jgi:ribonuclease HI
MSHYILFTDGSVHTQTRTGTGAALLIRVDEVSLPLEALRARINLQHFTNTSSTKLELETLLWALSEIPNDMERLTIYTDSQNIINLAERRAGFEQHNYHSQKGIPLRNAELYQAYFYRTDPLDFELIKVKGHQSKRNRDQIDQIFALIDRASRKARRATGNMT